MGSREPRYGGKVATNAGAKMEVLMSVRKWEEITREERFFTSVLFREVMCEPEPFWHLLGQQLKTSPDVSVVDVGFEVCYFRDAYHAEPRLIPNRQAHLEKQTFDMVLWLSDHGTVIIEAKAQQGFNLKQLNMLDESRKTMLELASPEHPLKRIDLVGLCSSGYQLRESTARRFDALVRWKEIAEAYPENSRTYIRADQIYGH